MKVKSTYTHSPDVRSLLKEEPAELLRNGILTYAVVFILLFFISYLIHYPDVITTDLTALSTIDGPSRNQPFLITLSAEDHKTLSGYKVLKIKLKSSSHADQKPIEMLIKNITYKDLFHGRLYSYVLESHKNNVSVFFNNYKKESRYDVQILTNDSSILERLVKKLQKQFSSKPQ